MIKRLCLNLVSVWCILGANAQATSIAVLDMGKIFSEALVVKDIQKQMEGVKGLAEKEINDMEHKAREQAEQLEKEKTKLTHRVYVERQEAIQKQVVSWQNLADKRKGQLDEAYGAAMDQVKSTLEKILEQVSKEKSIGIIMPSQHAAYVNVELCSNLTDYVMEQLNKQLPTLIVKLP